MNTFEKIYLNQLKQIDRRIYWWRRWFRCIKNHVDINTITRLWQRFK